MLSTCKARSCETGLCGQRSGPSIREQVEEVLVRELGHKVGEAHQMVDEAIKRNPSISSPEELFEEVYRGGNRQGDV